MSSQQDASRKNPLARSIYTIFVVVVQWILFTLAAALLIGAFLLVQHYLAGRPFNDANMLRLGQSIGVAAAEVGGILGPLIIMLIFNDEEKSRAQRVIAGLVAGFILGFFVLRLFSDTATVVLTAAAIGAVVCACIMFFTYKPAEA